MRDAHSTPPGGGTTSTTDGGSTHSEGETVIAGYLAAVDVGRHAQDGVGLLWGPRHRYESEAEVARRVRAEAETAWKVRRR